MAASTAFPRPTGRRSRPDKFASQRTGYWATRLWWRCMRHWGQPPPMMVTREAASARVHRRCPTAPPATRTLTSASCLSQGTGVQPSDVVNTRWYCHRWNADRTLHQKQVHFTSAAASVIGVVPTKERIARSCAARLSEFPDPSVVTKSDAWTSPEHASLPSPTAVHRNGSMPSTLVLSAMAAWRPAQLVGVRRERGPGRGRRRGMQRWRGRGGRGRGGRRGRRR